MWARLKRAPLHWKILLGGQFCVTIGLITHRLSAIRAAKEQKAAQLASKSKASQPIPNLGQPEKQA